MAASGDASTLTHDIERKAIMSTFAVWDMTLSRARAIAQKKTPTVIDNRDIPESEWLRHVEDATQVIMNGELIKQLSDKQVLKRSLRSSTDS
jgi:hypothetical protein